MELTPRRRRALSTVLALLLAVESVSAVAAAATVATGRTGAAGAGHSLPAEAPAGRVLAEDSVTARDNLPDAVTVAPGGAGPISTLAPAFPAAVAPAAVPASPEAALANRLAALAQPAAAATGGGSAPASSASYHGRNHVWIPALGINRSVSWFPCDRSRAPDNYVYRWGCAGANNVYLLGHASGVFKPLHDAYVSGRLRVGMRVWYADGAGHVRQYSVRWWKLTKPTTDASWAWAAQSVPSMTLQTCIGPNSEYRLIVRLTEVNG